MRATQVGDRATPGIPLTQPPRRHTFYTPPTGFRFLAAKFVFSSPDLGKLDSDKARGEEQREEAAPAPSSPAPGPLSRDGLLWPGVPGSPSRAGSRVGGCGSSQPVRLRGPALICFLRERICLGWLFPVSLPLPHQTCHFFCEAFAVFCFLGCGTRSLHPEDSRYSFNLVVFLSASWVPFP